MRTLIAVIALLATVGTLAPAYSADIDLVLTEPVGATPQDSVKIGFTKVNEGMTNLNVELADVQAQLALQGGGDNNVDLSGVQSALTSLQAELSALQNNFSTLQQQANQIADAQNGALTTLSDTQTDIAGLQSSVSSLTNRVAALENPGGGGGAGSVSVVIQDGLNSYTGTRDVHLEEAQPTTKKAYDAALKLVLDNSLLVQFDIFAAEGGPVPDGSTIVSATLELYKYSNNVLEADMYIVEVPWSEADATYNQRTNAFNWATAGANDGTLDYKSTDQKTIVTGGSEGWTTPIDITDWVTDWGNATEDNYGVIVKLSAAGVAGARYFRGSDYVADPTKRPKHTVTYD